MLMAQTNNPEALMTCDLYDCVLSSRASRSWRLPASSSPRQRVHEVGVGGGTDTVKVELRDASVHEALAVLSTKFGLTVHNSAALDQPVSGTYDGWLQQVIARLLNGRD